MMTHKQLEDFILTFSDAWLDFPFGEDVSVYKYGKKEDGDGKMFALIGENDKPLRLSLKCDPLLAETLRATYESIQPGYHLNKKYWNTVLMTGQVPDEEVRGFIHHSYELVSKSD